MASAPAGSCFNASVLAVTAADAANMSKNCSTRTARQQTIERQPVAKEMLIKLVFPQYWDAPPISITLIQPRWVGAVRAHSGRDYNNPGYKDQLRAATHSTGYPLP